MQVDNIKSQGDQPQEEYEPTTIGVEAIVEVFEERDRQVIEILKDGLRKLQSGAVADPRSR